MRGLLCQQIHINACGRMEEYRIPVARGVADDGGGGRRGALDESAQAGMTC